MLYSSLLIDRIFIRGNRCIEKDIFKNGGEVKRSNECALALTDNMRPSRSETEGREFFAKLDSTVCFRAHQLLGLR